MDEPRHCQVTTCSKEAVSGEDFCAAHMPHAPTSKVGAAVGALSIAAVYDGLKTIATSSEARDVYDRIRSWLDHTDRDSGRKLCIEVPKTAFSEDLMHKLKQRGARARIVADRGDSIRLEIDHA
jgi:hypothetical protein